MNSDSDGQGRGNVAPRNSLGKKVLLTVGLLVLVAAVACIFGSISSDDSAADTIESKDLQVGYNYWDNSSHPPVYKAEWKTFEYGRYIHYNEEVEKGKRLSVDDTDGIDVVAEYDEASGTLYIRENRLNLVRADDENGSLKIVALCDHLRLDGVSGMGDLELTSIERYSMELLPTSRTLSYNTLIISGSLTVTTGDPFDYWQECIFEECLERYYIETGTLTVKDNASFYGVVDMQEFMDDGYDGIFDFSGMSLSELEECDRYGLLAILKTDHMVVDTNGTIEVGLERYIHEIEGTKIPASMLIVMDNLDFIKCNEFIIYNAYVYDVDPTAHFIDDAEFMSKVKSNSLTGYTRSITTENIYGRECKVLNVARNVQIIDGVNITVPEPASGQQPGAPTEDDDRFAISSYEWAPNNVFEVGQHHTLRVMVTQNDNRSTFVGLTAAYIGGHPAVIETAVEKYAVISYEYAVPAPNLTASFNANGGMGLMDPVDNLYRAYSLPACTIAAPAGKHFKAWAEGGVNGKQYAAGASYDVQSDVTFFAIWEQNAFTIQPKTQAVEHDGTPVEIISSWTVNFVATKYDVMDGESVRTTVNDTTFTESSNAEQVLTLKIRAYYSSTEYVESDEFVLSWALVTYQIVVSPGEAEGSGEFYFARLNDVITIPAIEEYPSIRMDEHVFDYWSVRTGSPSAEGVEKDPGETFTVTGVTYIVAIWKEKTVTLLTAEYSGGDINAGQSMDTALFSAKLYYDDGSYDNLDKSQVGFYNGATGIGDIDDYTFETVGTVSMKATRAVSEQTYEAYFDVNVVGYTVSFNANGGSGLMPSLTNKYGSTALPTTASYIPVNGKYLVKWALGNSGGTQYDLGGSFNVTGDVTFYAIWEDKVPESLTATCQTKGFVGKYIDVTTIDVTVVYTDGSSDIVDKLAATYWLNTQQIQDIHVYQFDKVGVTTITVKYSGLQTDMDVAVINASVVKYKSGGGTGVMYAQMCEKDSDFILPECEYTGANGKTFQFWSVAIGGVFDDLYIPGDSIILTDDVTLTALWGYVLTFDAGDGTGSADPEISIGQYGIPANIFTAPSGKTFKCWSVKIGSAAAIEVMPEENINITADTTLTAIWGYKVIFAANGGAGTMASVVAEGSYVLPSCTFDAPSGKTFKCWSVNDAEKAAGDSISVAADTTATAVWKESVAPQPDPVGPQPVPVAPEPEYKEKDVGGKKVYSNEITSGATTDVSGIFNAAKSGEGSVDVKVGTMDISFDSGAVNAIAGKIVSLKAELKTTGLDVEGAKAVVEVILDGATFTDGIATVTLPFNETVPEGKTVAVYFINGTAKEKVDATYQDGKIVFTTNHFSKYAVMFEDASSSNGGGFPIWIVIVIVVVVAAAGVGVFFFMKNKKA